MQIESHLLACLKPIRLNELYFDRTHPNRFLLTFIWSHLPTSHNPDCRSVIWSYLPHVGSCHMEMSFRSNKLRSNFVQSKSATSNSLACHVTQLWSTKISLIYFSLIIYFHNLSHLFVTKTTTSLEIHTQSEYYPFGSFKLSSLEINKLLINNPN